MSSQGFWRVVMVGAASALLIVAVGTASVAGQAATKTSGIEGKVTDESGGVLPGVSVVISSPALLMPQLETVTDGNGRYRFTALPGGVYAVTFVISGFQKMTRQALNVDAGFVAPVDARLKVGQIEETVVVTGASPVVDVRTTSVVSTVKKDALETLPTSRSYEDMAKLAPGVRVSDVPDVGGNKTGGGRTSLVNYGSSNGGVTLMLDGVNTDGTAGYYDMGAVDEMIVRAAGNDPEIATPGMAFQAIVKSGGNAFHGDALFAFQARPMQGNNLDDRLRSLGVSSGNPMDHYYDAEGSTGGRLIRDRLWFFGSTRRKEFRQEVLGFAGAAGPDGVFFTADDEQGNRTSRESNLVGKVTSQLTAKHALSYMHHYSKKLELNNDANAFIAAPTAHTQFFPNHVWKGEWTYTPTNRSVLRAGVGRSYWLSMREPNTFPESDLPPTYDTVTQRYFGGGWDSTSLGLEPAPTGNDSIRLQYDTAYTYFNPSLLGGEHEFKVGGYFTREQYNRYQDAKTPGRGGAGNDYFLYLANGVPIEVGLLNAPFVSKNNVNYQSFYVRDTVRVKERLTINFGVRVERYHVFLPAQSKSAGLFSVAADFPRLELYDWRGIVPRVGMSYAITADNKTVVKATYGRYNFAIRPDTTSLVRPFNKNDHLERKYRWNDLDGDRAFDYPGELGDFIETSGGSGTVFNGDLVQPKTDEVTVFVERELAGGVSGRVGYVLKRESDLFQLVNTARPYEVYNIPIRSVDPGADGRAGTADDGAPLTYFDYDPAYRGPALERNTYLNVPSYTNTYNNVDVAVSKRLANRWQVQGSYLATKRNIWISGVPVTPNGEFFPKDQTWQTTFRMSGSYRAPWGILASGLYEYQSGTRQARDVLFRTGLQQLSNVTLRMEPLGSRHLPAVKLLNFRARKQFGLPRGDRFSVDFDLYNALNRNDATGRSVRSGPTYERITSILPPRVARLGFSYTF